MYEKEMGTVGGCCNERGVVWRLFCEWCGRGKVVPDL